MTVGILLTNTGTPDAPTTKAVRRYLREFLSDRRIVSLPRLLWLPILHGLVLTTRPKKSAKLYQSIWVSGGSPMRVHLEALLKTLQARLPNHPIALGMNYGNPSIASGISTLAKECEKIVVLPLFPQYSTTSTASSLDRVLAALKDEEHNPTVDFISDYAENPAYIKAVADSIRTHWDHHGKGDHLLISFHGIPTRLVKNGDPYQAQTEATAALIAAELQLDMHEWTLCYQSQFGYDKWLTPSTQQLFIDLPKQGINDIDVVCPGFSVDCLETLEEIAIKGRESFLAAGGEAFHYIPALNASSEHIDLLVDIIRKQQ